MPFYYTDKLPMPATQQLDGDCWILEQPFLYVRPNGDRIYVPASGIGNLEDMVAHPVWTTDYGSIPTVFQNLFKRDGDYGPAYLLHDWLYASEAFDRATCDWILLEALQELGAWWITRNTIYSAVRCGGGIVWANHKDSEVDALKKYNLDFLCILASHDNPWPEITGCVNG
jgi:hypothetical protein